VRDVAQRAERAGGAQRVAHAPQRLRFGPHPLDEGAQQDRLADARLTGDQCDAALPGDGAVGTVDEHVEGVLALQQSHSRNCKRSRRR
jgi:hypothetical protein